MGLAYKKANQGVLLQKLFGLVDLRSAKPISDAMCLRETMKNKLFSAVVMIGASLSASTGANAANYTWDLTGADAGYLTSITKTSGGHTLKVSAYSSTNTDGTGVLANAWMQRYSGGLGVANCISGFSCNETSSPNHSVDNTGKNDFVLLEFDSVMSAKAFQIGWKQTDADVQLWTGSASAAAGLNLATANACVSGSGCTTLASLGFTALPTFNDVAVGATNNIAAPNNSRYVLISGALDPGNVGNDYFKLSAFTAGLPLPLPSTLAMFAFALFGLTQFQKRRKN